MEDNNSKKVLFCPHCGNKVEQGIKKCKNCDEPIPSEKDLEKWLCYSCETLNNKVEKICEKCGKGPDPEYGPSFKSCHKCSLLNRNDFWHCYNCGEWVKSKSEIENEKKLKKETKEVDSVRSSFLASLIIPFAGFILAITYAIAGKKTVAKHHVVLGGLNILIFFGVIIRLWAGLWADGDLCFIGGLILVIIALFGYYCYI